MRSITSAVAMGLALVVGAKAGEVAAVGDGARPVLRQGMPGWKSLVITERSKTAIATEEAFDAVREGEKGRKLLVAIGGVPPLSNMGGVPPLSN